MVVRVFEKTKSRLVMLGFPRAPTRVQMHNSLMIQVEIQARWRTNMMSSVVATTDSTRRQPLTRTP